MKTSLWVSKLLLPVFFAFACSSSKDPGRSTSHKFFVQPVYLSVNGIERDTSIQRLFEEAFAKYKVRLISRDEMMVRNDNELKRAQQKLLLRKEELKAKGAEAIFKAMNDEVKYVSNMLSVSLELHDKDDSLMIYKVGWNVMPLPPSFNRPLVPKRREIDLTNLSYSIKENISSIVDSILYSKELK